MTILITRHDKIGDFITALPMAKVLKEQSYHKIIMLVSSINAPLAKSFDFIDSVIEYSNDTFALVKIIRSYKIDVSISAYIDNKLGLALFLSGIKTRIAPATKIAQIFFNKTLKQKRSEVKKTEWQYNLDLLHVLNIKLELNFARPLLNIKTTQKEPFIIFHVGSGGSSDGNLILDDYLKLAKKASAFTDICFAFGPDDNEDKKYILKHIDPNTIIKDNFKSLLEYTHFIARSSLFISTSTGPMHLAGLSNTPTLSFFGHNLFASSARWATVNDSILQHNFMLNKHYTKRDYLKIENTLLKIVKNG